MELKLKLDGGVGVAVGLGGVAVAPGGGLLPGAVEVAEAPGPLGPLVTVAFPSAIPPLPVVLVAAAVAAAVALAPAEGNCRLVPTNGRDEPLRMARLLPPQMPNRTSAASAAITSVRRPPLRFGWNPLRHVIRVPPNGSARGSAA